MATVLHTADVHLAPDIPEREAGLRAVLDLAGDLEVDVVTIGGDLFDDPADVDALRPTLRTDLFTDHPFDVLVIPGNHDREGFRGNTFFGDACRPILEEPFEHVTLPAASCRLTGVPFVDRPDEDLFVALAERSPYEGTEVLLLHCTLDVGFGPEAAGDETDRRYFPVTPAELAALEFDYVLAGHFHQPRREPLANGTFVYPGTPASTRRGETGRRQAAVLDLEAEAIGFEPLETYHYEHEVVEVLPGREDDCLDAIADWVDTAVGAHTDATVTVRGFHERDEAAFHAALRDAAAPATLEDETVTVARLRAHPLYRAFEERLGERDWDEATADAVRRRTLEAMSTVREAL